MEDKLLSVFPTKAEATELANKYAKAHDYQVEFLTAHHESPTVPSPAYIFRVITKPPRSENEIAYTGLPLCVVVDETTGYIYEARTL